MAQMMNGTACTWDKRARRQRDPHLQAAGFRAAGGGEPGRETGGQAALLPPAPVRSSPTKTVTMVTSHTCRQATCSGISARFWQAVGSSERRSCPDTRTRPAAPPAT